MNCKTNQVKTPYLWMFELIICYWLRETKPILLYNKNRNVQNHDKLYPYHLIVLMWDFISFSYFYPGDHQTIKISKNGLTAMNSSKKGHGTVLFGYPIYPLKNIIDKLTCSKHMKFVHCIEIKINDIASDPCWGGWNNVKSPSVAVGIVPITYKLFQGMFV